MAIRSWTGIELCAGVGWLGLGIELACRHLGIEYRTVCHVERCSYAAATLVARMEDSALAAAPVWDDIESFDGRPWRGRVDCVSAGFPCQPWSVAGQQRGRADERWIWPHLVRIVREVEPGIVVLENVPGLCSGGVCSGPDRRRGVHLDSARQGKEGWWQLSASGGSRHVGKGDQLVEISKARTWWKHSEDSASIDQVERGIFVDAVRRFGSEPASRYSAIPEAEQCGWLKDKYGLSWQIVPTAMNELMGTKDKDKLVRVTQAFLKMKKFDIAELKAAAGDK